MPCISYDDFAKLDIRTGIIQTAARVPETDKLVKLTVDIGEPEPRQVIAGIALFVEDVEALPGTKCLILANLEPRTLRGLVSDGMLLAAGETAENFSLAAPAAEVPPGTRIH